jgi:putative sugar O-methyltransferase
MRRLREMAATLSRSQGGLNEPRLVRALRGAAEAERDFDAARLAWNHEAWPVDLDAFGESTLGSPLHRYAVGPDSEVRYTKPYLNYMLCMAALSRHVDEPPRSFVELGGGFGVLGEFVLARDAEARYVNFDIPPLLTVSSYYLTSLFGDERVRTFDEDLPESGPLELPGSACLPNWRIGDLVGNYDVFVNSYSFQEMEPFVVEHYIDCVARLGVKYAVSLNSIHGKHIAQGADDVGVKEQVVSDTIIAMFEARGYELAGRYHRPLITGAGELAVLRRR